MKLQSVLLTLASMAIYSVQAEVWGTMCEDKNMQGYCTDFASDPAKCCTCRIPSSYISSHLMLELVLTSAK